MKSQLRVLGGNTNNANGQPQVVIGKNLKKTSVMIDKDGNHIDPVTKQIIKRNSDNTPTA